MITNSNFAVKLAERSNRPFLISIWWIYFSNICTFWYKTMEWIELNWLRRHLEKVRFSQASISVNFSTMNLVKHSFSLWVSLNSYESISMPQWRLASRSLWERQSKVLERSFNNEPNDFPLPTADFHFSSMANRQYCVL